MREWALKDRHRLIARLFVLFFSVSISVAVLPCGIINTHGLFGEITSSVVTDGEEESTIQESCIYLILGENTPPSIRRG